MVEGRIRLLSSDDIFKDCLFLLKSKDGSIAYCIKYKLWNEPCPPRCDQFIPDEPGSIEEAQSSNYDIECRDFTRKMISQSGVDYFCETYKQKQPFCHSCIFQRYVSDP